MSYSLNQGPEILFLGDWITTGNYAEWDGELLTFRMLD